MTTISPKTGKKIKIGGSAYLKLARDPKWSKWLSPPPTKAEKKSTPGSRGCSGQRKWIRSGISKEEFCGPEGGACPYTYPVNTRKRARAALAYARYAPDPEGIRECVRKKAQQKGWLDEQTGKIKMVTMRGTPYRVRKNRHGRVSVEKV